MYKILKMEEQPKKRGRPRNTANEFRTSLIIERDLYVRVRKVALEENETVKSIVDTALRNYLKIREPNEQE